MPCITLISDFGLRDASVAIAKGVLMQHARGVPIIDISHEVIPYHTAQAAYLLGTAWGSFPEGTIHVVLFDIFSDALPRLVLSEYKGHYFLSPDNGVLPATLGALPSQSWLCFELTPGHSFTDWLHAAGNTISKLLSTENTNQQINQSTNQPINLPPIQLINQSTSQPINQSTSELACEVIHTDHYGNVVTSVTRDAFEAARQGRRFRLEFMQSEELTELSSHYHDVREGYRLCRFNSNGYLEICINRGNAAGLLGLRPGSRHNNLKLYFE